MYLVRSSLPSTELSSTQWSSNSRECNFISQHWYRISNICRIQHNILSCFASLKLFSRFCTLVNLYSFFFTLNVWKWSLHIRETTTRYICHNKFACLYNSKKRMCVIRCDADGFFFLPFEWNFSSIFIHRIIYVYMYNYCYIHTLIDSIVEKRNTIRPSSSRSTEHGIHVIIISVRLKIGKRKKERKKMRLTTLSLDVPADALRVFDVWQESKSGNNVCYYFIINVLLHFG